jgi:hypothetical protein
MKQFMINTCGDLDSTNCFEHKVNWWDINGFILTLCVYFLQAIIQSIARLLCSRIYVSDNSYNYMYTRTNKILVELLVFYFLLF